MPQSLALVMISNLGRADGGRETWAYQFIPRLLSRNPELSIKLYGLRIEGQPDTSHQLRSAIPSEGRQRLRTHFFRIGRSWIPNSLKMIWAMFRRDPDLEADNFDLALGVGSFVELLCMLVAPGLRRSPKAIWLRTIYLDEKSHRIPGWLRPLAAVAEKAVLRMADLIIANGDDTAAYYRARGLKVEVIKNAVDLERWRMPPPRFKRPIEVAFVGRLTAVKGAGEFLEVCRRMTGTASSGAFQFHIVGEGEFTPEAKALAAERRLTLHGTISNDRIPDLLKAIDVCVCLTFSGQQDGGRSSGAGVSNALLEQMAAGRLCLCWDNAAFRQVLSDNACYFVRQGDLKGLVTTLERVADDPAEARTRAMTGAALSENYGIEAHMSRFARIVSQWLRIE